LRVVERDGTPRSQRIIKRKAVRLVQAEHAHREKNQKISNRSVIAAIVSLEGKPIANGA
jgi:hypothetical protein